MQACRSRDVILLNKLLNNGANVNQSGTDGQTPLMLCAENNDVACTTALLKAGANVNAKNQIGKDALMFAARAAGHSCIKELIEAGADVNVLSRSGVIALGYFVVRHCWELKCDACPLWVTHFSNETFEGDSPPFPEEQKDALKLILLKGSKINGGFFKRRNMFLPNCLFDMLHAAGVKMKIFSKWGKTRWTKNKKAAHKQPPGMKEVCRDVIRKRLIKVDKTNLFLRIPQLGLPTALSRFLLFDQEMF